MKPTAGLVLVFALLIFASPALGTSLRLDKVMDGRVPQVSAEVRGATRQAEPEQSFRGMILPPQSGGQA